MAIHRNLSYLSSKLTFLAILAVLGLSGCQLRPQACFDASNTTPLIDEIVSFTNCSMDGDHYEWDFGDGTKSTDFEPTHFYLTAGKYNVWLTAYSKNGKKSSQSLHTVTVQTDGTYRMSELCGTEADVYYLGVIDTIPGDTVVLENLAGLFYGIQAVKVGSDSFTIVPVDSFKSAFFNTYWDITSGGARLVADSIYMNYSFNDTAMANEHGLINCTASGKK